MFLLPKCDLGGKRTDEGREFVETRRRQEAIWFGITRSFSLPSQVLIACVFQKLQLQATSRSNSPTPFNMPRPKATTNAFESLWKAYNDNTPNRLKFIDSFLLFLMLSGVVQFAYCILVSNFPYNAFLSG